VFSQTIKDLKPGRLYWMKMFTCDYNDLIHPRKSEVTRTWITENRDSVIALPPSTLSIG
jgi:hypothetical protein